MNNRFHFTVDCPRWGHEDTYHLDIHSDGWSIRHIAINGDCDKRGDPYLFENLLNDGIEYPAGLGMEMELLFEHARDGTLPEEEIQKRLDRLARWVNDVNAVPRPEFEE